MTKKTIILILLSTLFISCNEGTRYDEPDAPITLVETTVDVLPDSEFWKDFFIYDKTKPTFTILKNQTLEANYDEDYITLPLSAISNEEIFIFGVRIFRSASYSADQNKYIEDNMGREVILDNGILYLRPSPYYSGTFDIVIIWRELNNCWQKDASMIL